MAEARKGGTNTSKGPPEGAVNMHKSMAMGASRKEAEGKALTESQVEKKER